MVTRGTGGARSLSERRAAVEPEPKAVPILFGQQIDLVRRYVAALSVEGEARGLIGPLERERIWSRHILNCAAPADLLVGRVADVGSGAGLPGLVLAMLRPELEFTLIEPMERRVAWLEEQRAALELGNVRIHRGRAEDDTLRGQFDQVTARAVGGLKVLVPLVRPLLRSGGQLLLLKGANVEAEITVAARSLRAAELTEWHVDVLPTGMATEVSRVFRATVR